MIPPRDGYLLTDWLAEHCMSFMVCYQCFQPFFPIIFNNGFIAHFGLRSSLELLGKLLFDTFLLTHQIIIITVPFSNTPLAHCMFLTKEYGIECIQK